MDLETYADRIDAALAKRNVAKGVRHSQRVTMLVAHCHMKGATVAKAADSIARQLLATVF